MEENQKQEKPFKCTGDCMTCREDRAKRMAQWRYCSAQHTYNSMRMIGDMQEALKSMQGTIDELKAKIEAIQNSETDVLDPVHASNIQDNIESNVESNIAQDGDGAVEGPRDSVTL